MLCCIEARRTAPPSSMGSPTIRQYRNKGLCDLEEKHNDIYNSGILSGATKLSYKTRLVPDLQYKDIHLDM